MHPNLHLGPKYKVAEQDGINSLPMHLACFKGQFDVVNFKYGHLYIIKTVEFSKEILRVKLFFGS